MDLFSYNVLLYLLSYIYKESRLAQFSRKNWKESFLHNAMHTSLVKFLKKICLLKGLSAITAPFNNMRNLKFKKPLVVAFSLPSINEAEVLENE